MSRPRHPDKHIEGAVQYAEALGWRVEMSEGHAWGHLLCPRSTREGCIIPVWSTPRVPENHRVKSDGGLIYVRMSGEGDKHGIQGR